VIRRLWFCDHEAAYWMPRQSRSQLGAQYFLSGSFTAGLKYPGRADILCPIGKARFRAITGSFARHDPAADACELGDVP
jgi:hypothetical protein